MALMKKIFNTILILLGIGFMACVLGLAIMMIFHVNMFGITYITLKQGEAEFQKQFSNSDLNRLNTIDISTSKIDVTLQYGNQNYMYIEMNVDMKGFVKDDVTKVEFISEPNVDENGVLKIETIEPSGWVFANSSTLKIYLPNNRVVDNVKVDTAADSINIGVETDFKVNNLEVLAQKKFFDASVNIGEKVIIYNNLTLKTNYGKINIKSDIRGNVNIDSLYGSILINSNIGGNVDIMGTNPFVAIGSIPGGWRNKKEVTSGDLDALTKVDVAGNVTIHDVTDGGNVKVSGTIGGFVYINAPDVEFWANTITGGMNCDSGANELRIFGTLGSTNCDIDNGNGSLFINNCLANLNVTSAKGDVRIANAKGNVDINRYVDLDSTSTNIYVVVNFDASVNGKTMTAKTKNGNIEATNISGAVDLFTEKGSITADFLKVVGDNKIEAKNNINVRVKDSISNPAFELTTKATAGSVNVQMIPVVYTDWSGHTNNDGWKTRTDIINGSTVTGNKLLLKMNGSDRIKAELYI